MNTRYWPEEQNEFFKKLVGKKIIDARGLCRGSKHVSILFEDGSAIRFYHSQSCCESVDLDDICGDVDDLLNAKLYGIELRNNFNQPARDCYDESYTWSFYSIRTDKGYVDLKWYGCSNGYYSETVDVEYYQPDYDNWESKFESY